MKKVFAVIFSWIVAVSNTFACGPEWEPDYEYYNLFLQEIIGDTQYFPFLLTYKSAFYGEDPGNGVALTKQNPKNENIEEWQPYFGLSYDETYYLVFKAQGKDLQQLIAGEKIFDEKLHFATPAFVARFKEALTYLDYAKSLEPYMAVIPSGGGWYYRPSDYASVDELNYAEVTSFLENAWKNTKDKELKLRYGYQLVRFAHYSRRFEDAVRYFDTCVEPLNYKPAMYYHALSQKAGAEKGQGNVSLANYHFLQVFVHSRDLKEMAMTSIKFGDNTDWNDLLNYAKNENERNDAYLMLGYNDFTNPLNEIEKIVASSPDAVQAKILMARAVNYIERNAMQVYFWGSNGAFDTIPDKRYPVLETMSNPGFVQNTLVLADGMANNSKVKDKNFWYITAAYLHFLKKDFTGARSYLEKVTNSNDKYTLQKKNLAMYIDVSEHPRITPELEVAFYSKYKDVFKEGVSDRYLTEEDGFTFSSRNFVIDVLANRYYLQHDYGKSFLLNNNITQIENQLQPQLLGELHVFYYKPGKNVFEKYLAKNLVANRKPAIDTDSYFAYLWGIYYLTQGDISKSQGAFKRMLPATQEKIVSKSVFGVNIVECFECNQHSIISSDYLSDFAFIKESMSFNELTQVLLQLQKIGEGDNKLAAKANYLIGNFYYNTTRMGYHRHLFRFASDNGNNYKYYASTTPTNIFGNIYFKYYPTYYENAVSESQLYLEKAYTQAESDELKAQIVFALSKCEQEAFNDSRDIYSQYWIDEDGVLITNRKYFKELMKYRNTKYFSSVQTNCKYFDYYVANCWKK